MPITNVRYSAEFSVNGLKRWISCEATVLKEGDEEKEMDAVIAFCYKTNERVHPQNANPGSSNLAAYGLYSEPISMVPIEKKAEEEQPIMKISVEDEIKSFTDPSKLKKVYGLLASIDKNIKPVYDEMMDKLLINAVIGTKKSTTNDK